MPAGDVVFRGLLDSSATLADEFCCDAQQGVAANVIASAHSHSVTVNTVDDADFS
jgi:hypothetical protein